jgi:hypothetical protein
MKKIKTHQTKQTNKARHIIRPNCIDLTMSICSNGYWITNGGIQTNLRGEVIYKIDHIAFQYYDVKTYSCFQKSY